MNDVFHIVTLLLKKKFKALTLQEKLRLKQFQEEYPFVKTIRVDTMAQRISGHEEIDGEAGWNRVLYKLEERQKESRASVVRKRRFRYTAAAAIILLVSVSSMFILNTPQQHHTVPPSAGIIKTGTDKASLTLEDGSEITLGGETGYKAKNAYSNGKQIVYHAGNRGRTSETRYNYLTVPRGGQFFIQLADSTRVWLNSESRLKYPVTFVEGEPRRVELLYGEAYFEVSPATHHKGARFKVHTHIQEVEVSGTAFNIRAYRDEADIRTTLVEGKVTVNTDNTNKVLAPGQQLNLHLENKQVTVSEVDVYNEISWKKGLFSFKGMPLKEIAKVLSRWYDIEVKFADPDLEEVRFNGVLSKDQELEEILKIIQNTNFINAYEIKNRKITIK